MLKASKKTDNLYDMPSGFSPHSSSLSNSNSQGREPFSLIKLIKHCSFSFFALTAWAVTISFNSFYQIAYSEENSLLKIHINEVKTTLLKTDLRDHLIENHNSEKDIISVADLEAAQARLAQAESELLGKPSTAIEQNSSATTKIEEEAARLANNRSQDKDDPAAENKNENIDHKVRAALNIAANELSIINSQQKPQENKTTISSEIISSLREQNIRLSTRLQEAQSKNAELIKTLDETRNRLMLAETQVERLSAILENRNAKAIKTSPELTASKNQHYAQPPINIIARRQTAVSQEPSQTLTKETSSISSHKISDRIGANIEIPIATVVADKVNLRTGPGRDNSPLMSVSKGTRLAVETRVGDWFRVIAPNGTRAWIESEVVVINGSR
jgi:hypothetical protein